MNRKNIGVLVVAIVLIGIAVIQNFSKANEVVLPEEEAPKANFLTPSFTLEDMHGEAFSVGGERDKMLIINFWASWCGPCHAEAPDLVELHDKYSDVLDIYAVNVTQMDTLRSAERFIEEYGFQFPVPLDVDNEVTEIYNVQGYPTSFLVDTNGVIQEVYPRMLLPNDIDRIERTLKRM